jgi:hypothetical protein
LFNTDLSTQMLEIVGDRLKELNEDLWYEEWVRCLANHFCSDGNIYFFVSYQPVLLHNCHYDEPFSIITLCAFRPHASAIDLVSGNRL